MATAILEEKPVEQKIVADVKVAMRSSKPKAQKLPPRPKVKVRNGIVVLPSGQPVNELMKMLSSIDFGFDEIVLECHGIDTMEHIADLAIRLENALETKGIVKDQPIVVAVADVPANQRNKVVAFLNSKNVITADLTAKEMVRTAA